MQSKIVKDVIIGFLVTVAANLAGMYFYISAVSDLGTLEAIDLSIKQGFFSSILGLGAIMDFLPFYVFLRKRQFYRLRGVLLAVITAAIIVLIFKIQTR